MTFRAIVLHPPATSWPSTRHRISVVTTVGDKCIHSTHCEASSSGVVPVLYTWACKDIVMRAQIENTINVSWFSSHVEAYAFVGGNDEVKRPVVFAHVRIPHSAWGVTNHTNERYRYIPVSGCHSKSGSSHRKETARSYNAREPSCRKFLITMEKERSIRQRMRADITGQCVQNIYAEPLTLKSNLAVFISARLRNGRAQSSCEDPCGKISSDASVSLALRLLSGPHNITSIGSSEEILKIKDFLSHLPLQKVSP